MRQNNKIARGLLASALVAASLTLVGCWEQSATQLVESGKARMQKKEFRAAAIEFKNALQKDGTLVEARFYLGKALFESGDPRSSWLELSKARDAGYNNDELVPLMVANLLMLGQVDKFLAEYADVQLTSPKSHAELKAALAVAYGSKGKYLQARAAADAALQADPTNIVAQLAVARLLLVTGDRAGALNQVDRTIKEHPESAQAWSSRAELLLAGAGDPSEAMTAYREALRLQPDQLDAHLGIISMLWRQRDLVGVDKQLVEFRKRQPNSPYYQYYQGLLAIERKDLKVAREHSQQLLKIAPENSRFLHFAGMVEYERGSYVQAIAHLYKALPNSAAPLPLRVLLARAQLRAGDPRKALAAVQPLLDQSDSKLPTEVYAVAADAYLQLGDAEAARKMNLLAVKVNPQDKRGLTALALADMQYGRAGQGIASLESIAAADKGIEADAMLFIAHMRASRLEDAERVVDGIEKKAPDLATGPYLRGQLEEHRKHSDKARELYEVALKRSATYVPALTALAKLDVAAGKPAQAAQRFEKLVAANPESVDAVIALISARGKAGVKPEEIQAQLEAAVKRFPDSEAPRLALVRLLLERRDVKAALTAATDGAARFPAHAPLQEVVGLAELAAGNHNQAMQAFNRAAALRPNAVEPLMRIAEVHLARNDIPATIAQLRKALTVKADHLPAQAALINLLMRSGKADEALTQARILQTQLPQDPTGWTYEGELQFSKRNFAAAISALRTSLAKRADGSTAVKLHRALNDAGQAAEATKFEADWLAKQPSDPVFNFYRGDAAMSRQQFDRAEAIYRQVLAVRPDDPTVLNNVAWLMHRGGKPGALAMAERAIALVPDSAPLLDTAAEIHAAAGRLDKALELQQRALKLDPDQAMHRLHYAKYLIKNGNKVEARVELEKLGQLGKSFSAQDEVLKLLSTL